MAQTLARREMNGEMFMLSRFKRHTICVHHINIHTLISNNNRVFSILFFVIFIF